MNFDFLNSFGNTLGQGIGHVGNGLSYMGDTMSAGYDRASGFDAFGLGSGLRSGMADSGLSQNAIDNLMTAGKWGAGLGLAGALMDGGQGGMQGLGMGLLGGGLGSYLQQQNGQKDEKKGNIFDSGLLSSLNQDVTPQFQSLPAPSPIGRSNWMPLDAYRKVGRI